MKVMTVLGTRPEIIRLSRTIAALDSVVDHILVHTGQNYDHELNQIFFDDLNIRLPDKYLNAAGATAAESIGQIIMRADEVFREVLPDAVLFLGDTNSCMAAIPAKKNKIPIFHMEAGNRSFDQRVPEETNRRIVDHISDINLPYSSIAREYLLREGFSPDRIIKTGSPMMEVLNFYEKRISESQILSRLRLEVQKYFVFSAHREENVDCERQLGRLIQILNNLAETTKLPVLVTLHPRTRKRLEGSETKLHELVQLHKPFSFTDYIQLQKHSKAVLSDSGTITEESSILGFPALNIRESHERPEGMEEASVIMTGLKWDVVSAGLRTLEKLDVPSVIPADYNVPEVSRKIVKIILSYTPYVRQNVWKISV